jgi:hypothetical protein
MSRPEPLCQHEEHYLQRSLEALPDGLQSLDRVIDVIQASCLLSMYFLANGRLFEGSYHASAAAALTTQTDLGRRTYSHTRNWTVDAVESDLKPPKSDTFEGEKILAFWQVYNLDRCWSVVLRKPCVIPDKLNSRHSICCPWPQDIDYYENVSCANFLPFQIWRSRHLNIQGHVDTTAPLPIIRAFLSGSVSPNGFSIAALRVKASALFAHADHLSANCKYHLRSCDLDTQGFAGTKTSRLSDEIQSLEHTITLFLSTLIPIAQLDAVLPDEKHGLIVTYSLAHAAMIHLHRAFALSDAVSFDKCSQASRACISVVKHISDGDFAFLEPIIGVRTLCSILLVMHILIFLYTAMLVVCCRYSRKGLGRSPSFVAAGRSQ